MEYIDYEALRACDNAGMSGNCGTDKCSVLMEGNCEYQDQYIVDFDLCTVEFVSDPVCPDAIIKETPEDAYERAMEILN